MSAAGAMRIDRLDHFVLTVADVAATCAFYQRALGMDVVSFSNDRKALAFGQQKINLHAHGHEFEPKADRPTPGAADFCLITDVPLAEVMAHLAAQGVAIVAGPVPRSGATGKIVSIYLRDPDGNLVEIANRAAE
jgi:catechol 2,3-dioxygenase-like lactoylglutathione lyase family enzyme